MQTWCSFVLTRAVFALDYYLLFIMTENNLVSPLAYVVSATR